MSEIIVSAERIERVYGSGATAVHVLRGVDLHVATGQIVGLYGPSGSGKTTLLNLIGALDMPTAGSLSVCGQNVLKLSERGRAAFRRKKIGFIFQNSTLLPTYTAVENIDMALRIAGLHFWERRKRAKAILSAVGLSAWADHVPDEMSGGQRQRIAIARALASRPTLVLADEPTSGLDTKTTSRILTLFKGIAAAEGTTFVLVSHDPLVAEFADTVYDLNEGQLLPRGIDEPDFLDTLIPVPELQG